MTAWKEGNMKCLFLMQKEKNAENCNAEPRSECIWKCKHQLENKKSKASEHEIVGVKKKWNYEMCYTCSIHILEPLKVNPHQS